MFILAMRFVIKLPWVKSLIQIVAEQLAETFTDYVYENAEGEISLVEQDIYSFY